MNKCKTCKWHKEDPKSNGWEEQGRDCTCPKIREDEGNDSYEDDALVYSYPEGGYFWTGDNFGCIHHEPNPNIIDQIIQDFEDEKRGK